MESLNVLSSVLHFGTCAQGICGTNLATIRSPEGLPPSIQSFLFENQWAWWLSFLVVSIAARFAGRNRNDGRLIIWGWVLFGVTALWMATASLVVTPRERLQLAHTALANAAGNHDIAAIAALLDPDFHSPNLDITRRAVAEEEIADRLKTYGIKSNTITRFQSEMVGGDEAMTQITVITATETLPNIPTTWELEWKDVPGQDWRIRSATLTKIADQPVGRDHIIPR